MYTNNGNRSWEDEVAGGEVSQKLPYFQPGFDDDVEILETIKFDSPEKGPLWIVSVKIDTSNHPAHPVGQKFSWTQKLASRAAPGAVLEFLVAALEGDPRNPDHVNATRPHVVTVLRQSQNNPANNQLTGKKVHLMTLGTRKKDGGPFTKHMWGRPTGTAGAPVQPPVQPPVQLPTFPTVPVGTGGSSTFALPWQK